MSGSYRYPLLSLLIVICDGRTILRLTSSERAYERGYHGFMSVRMCVLGTSFSE